MSEILNGILAFALMFLIYYIPISLGLMILRSIFCCEDKSEKKDR